MKIYPWFIIAIHRKTFMPEIWGPYANHNTCKDDIANKRKDKDFDDYIFVVKRHVMTIG